MAKLTEAQMRMIVAAYTPPGWVVRESAHRTKTGSGLATMQGKIISIPELKDEHAMFVFFHEVAHVTLGHFQGAWQPAHVDEYQAERAAIAMCRQHGIKVSRKELKDAKDNVRDRLLRDEKNGVRPSPLVWNWVFPKAKKSLKRKQ